MSASKTLPVGAGCAAAAAAGWPDEPAVAVGAEVAAAPAGADAPAGCGVAPDAVLAGVAVGLDLRRLHRVRVARRQREHPADVDGARVHTERALDARRTQLTGDSQIGVQLDVGELIVDDLELIRLDRDLDAPDLALMQG